MGLISLLILAAVAGFLFYQLRGMLGQTPYDTKKRQQEKQKNHTLENQPNQTKDVIIDMIKIPDDYEHRFIKASPDIDRDSILETLNQIKIRYTEFDLNKFIEGAKGAYDMILESFNRDLPEDIKVFINNDIYNNYRKLLDEYKEKNYKYETVVTRIDKAVITSVETNEVYARISVEFDAYNISVLKDNTGTIIQGDPDNVIAVHDIWTFERHYNTNTPAWIVVAVV